MEPDVALSLDELRHLHERAHANVQFTEGAHQLAVKAEMRALASAIYYAQGVERLHSWAGLIELLDEHWPEDIFPTLEDDPQRDVGARFISIVRWLDRARAERDAAVARAEAAEAERDAFRRGMDLVLSLHNDDIENARECLAEAVLELNETGDVHEFFGELSALVALADLLTPTTEDATDG